MRTFLILTTDAKTLKWKSLPAKLAEIKNSLKVWEVDIEHADVTPVVKDGRVDHEWLQKTTASYLDKKYDLVAVHMPMSQGQKQLNGANPKQGHDFYFWADENTKRKGLSQFVQTCLHEFSHEYFQKTGLPDVTHLEHDKTGDVKPLVESFDWSLFKTQRNVLTAIVEALKAQIKALTTKPTILLHPVPAPFNKYITQGYGVKNPIYKKTGVHCFIDYATPTGTAIIAPADGEVVTSYDTKGERGIIVQFKHGNYLLEVRHLSRGMPLGKYRRGKTIAYTGNTGTLTTGPHVCLGVWAKGVDNLSVINKSNWMTLTEDPRKVYG